MFLKEFNRKSDVVDQRFFQEHEIKLDYSLTDKVIAVDIDGVLSDYQSGVVDFLHVITHTLYTSVEEAKRVIDPVKWEELKHQYRISGYKRDMPVYKDAAKFLIDLKDAGYYIALISARPFKEYPRINNLL